MSLEAVRPFFQEHVSALGFTEWEEPFDAENLPSTIIDRAFNLRVLSVNAGPASNQSVQFNVTQQVLLYFKGYQDNRAAVEKAMTEAETVIINCLNPANFGVGEVKGVFLDSLEIDALDENVNDNIVIARIVFSVTLFACL
jgi:hypothetical protein